MKLEINIDDDNIKILDYIREDRTAEEHVSVMVNATLSARRVDKFKDDISLMSKEDMLKLEREKEKIDEAKAVEAVEVKPE